MSRAAGSGKGYGVLSGRANAGWMHKETDMQQQLRKLRYGVVRHIICLLPARGPPLDLLTQYRIVILW